MQKSKKGFSLIELLLVLIMIGMIAVMTVNFTVRNKDRWSLRDTSREITSSYYQAKQRAARENESIRLDVGAKEYALYRYNGVSWEAFRREPFPEKINASATASFLINPSGFILDPVSLQIAGSQTITLSAPHGALFDTMTITVYPYGGLRVQKAFQ